MQRANKLVGDIKDHNPDDVKYSPYIEDPKHISESNFTVDQPMAVSQRKYILMRNLLKKLSQQILQ